MTEANETEMRSRRVRKNLKEKKTQLQIQAWGSIRTPIGIFHTNQAIISPTASHLVAVTPSPGPDSCLNLWKST